MRCANCREAVSARLDDEERPGERSEVDAHLAACSACRLFAERAARVTRLARTSPVEPVPDMVSAVHDALPIRRRRRWSHVPRVLLAAVGVGQLGLAARDLLAVAGHRGDGAPVGGTSLTHISHESSAWNLALAVGFLCVAARPARGRGMLPLIGAFVTVLTGLSLVDLALHRVAGSRLLAHSLVVIGLGALLALTRQFAPTRGDFPDKARHTPPHGDCGAAEPDSRQFTEQPMRSTGEHDLRPSARYAA